MVYRPVCLAWSVCWAAACALFAACPFAVSGPVCETTHARPVRVQMGKAVLGRITVSAGASRTVFNSLGTAPEQAKRWSRTRLGLITDSPFPGAS